MSSIRESVSSAGRLAVIALVIGLTAAPARAAVPVDVSVRLDPTEVAAGQNSRVELTIGWEGAPDLFTIEELVAPECSGATLPAESDQSQTSVENGKPVFRRRIAYTIHTATAGALTLAPARVKLKGADGRSSEYKSQMLTLTVTAPPSRLPWTEIGLGGLVAVLIVVAAVAARRSRPARAQNQNRPDVAARIDPLRTIGRSNHREFFERCLTTLKEGLAEDRGLPIKEREKARIVKALADAGFPEAKLKAVEELFDLCDEGRFNPDPPADSARNRALTLLETILAD